jgi:hypothetical protein
MSNTIPSLPARIAELKQPLIKEVGATIWNNWQSNTRGTFILGILDEGALQYNDNFSYDCFLKAYHTMKGVGGISMNISFDELIIVLEMAERYAKNWAFS